MYSHTSVIFYRCWCIPTPLLYFIDVDVFPPLCYISQMLVYSHTSVIFPRCWCISTPLIGCNYFIFLPDVNVFPLLHGFIYLPDTEVFPPLYYTVRRRCIPIPHIDCNSFIFVSDVDVFLPLLRR